MILPALVLSWSPFGGLLPDIVRGLILAVAALFVIIGVIQLID